MGFPRQEYWSGLPLPSPRQSSRPRDRTIADGFLHCGKMLYYWATREAPKLSASSHILFYQGLTWIRPPWIVMGYWWELNPCWLVSWQGDRRNRAQNKLFTWAFISYQWTIIKHLYVIGTMLGTKVNNSRRLSFSKQWTILGELVVNKSY